MRKYYLERPIRASLWLCAGLVLYSIGLWSLMPPAPTEKFAIALIVYSPYVPLGKLIHAANMLVFRRIRQGITPWWHILGILITTLISTTILIAAFIMFFLTSIGVGYS